MEWKLQFYLTHLFPMHPFKAFMEAMIYTLFKVTTGLKFLQQFLFLKIYQGWEKVAKKYKHLLHLVIIFQEF